MYKVGGAQGLSSLKMLVTGHINVWVIEVYFTIYILIFF